MNFNTTLLGTTAVTKLQETAAFPILQIGSDKLTRHDLAGVDCFNFIAAFRLSRVLHEQLQVKSLRDVYENVPPSALALPHIGVIALAVLGAAFEAKGVGGDDPLGSWAKRHATKPAKGEAYHLTTFYTIKKREQALTGNSNNRRKRRR